MTVAREEYRHPSEATRVRLLTYEERGGFLVTEERIGAATVVATLGFVPSRQEAAALLRRRADDLMQQRYERLDAADTGADQA